ncbi:antibiotic biosynthesis monooxygenase [Trichocoleus sp. FACHB-262]|uniref:antibiotic biosynthesis monooxygenase n=1 Tax=Trichocoleus sp. FACHB-262 TaxID=2692869 RepID=UPI001683E234|nr:antibiotic biosynthesis monooxygenase [Trichocoleus sp. FACHB-262]MBD2124233.1 antibiotic biosynthesis monooxygenase [Trichocoleus sp. FACHB-262]
MQTDPPVTVDVVQQVTRGKEREFEALLEQIISTASTFEGYLGSSVFRPSGQDDHEYRIIFKFDHLENLQRWEHSSVRQRFLNQARNLTVDAGTFSIITGLETWFTLPAKPGMLPPPRYKMVLVSGIAIFGINQILAVLPLAWLAQLPSVLRLLILVFLTTTLMTYVVMPRLTKLLAWWLYPKR